MRNGIFGIKSNGLVPSTKMVVSSIAFSLVFHTSVHACTPHGRINGLRVVKVEDRTIVTVS